MGITWQAVADAMERGGYRGRIVGIGHLRELQAEIEGHRQAGVLDPKLWQRYLESFRFDYARELPGAQSLIVVAIPQPMAALHFGWRGKRHRVMIPPTYIVEDDPEVTALLERMLRPERYSLLRARLPQKLLAVRSGLARYGRNNIAYVDGMGSFCTIMAFVTDLPVAADGWQAARRMPECDTCRACLKNCPTGCIDPERPVIHAEKCLTYFNEAAGAMPEWVEGGWHNAWIGCLKCQTVCPRNRDQLAAAETGAAFDEVETGLLLQGAAIEQLPAATRAELRRLNLEEYYRLPVLSRNLGLLLDGGFEAPRPGSALTQAAAAGEVGAKR